jgi:hypothetical protein
MRHILGFALLSIVFGHCDGCPELSDVLSRHRCPSREHSASSWRIRGYLERTLEIASDVTIKTEGEKTFKILSRVIEGKQDRTGVVIFVVDGVSYLQELHTSNAKFIFQNGIEGSK